MVVESALPKLDHRLFAAHEFEYRSFAEARHLPTTRKALLALSVATVVHAALCPPASKAALAWRCAQALLPCLVLRATHTRRGVASWWFAVVGALCAWFTDKEAVEAPGRRAALQERADLVAAVIEQVCPACF